jgi:hypothetical protein
MQFTIRDIIWLTILVALLIGWLLDHGVGQRDRLEFQKRLAEAQQLNLEQRLDLENVARQKATSAIENSLP